MNTQMDQNSSKQGRVVGVVIAVGGLLAILAPWLTDILGLPVRFEMLFYFVAIGAFVWALVVALQIWRKRQENQR